MSSLGKRLTLWFSAVALVALLGYRITQARAKRAAANAPVKSEVFPVSVASVALRTVSDNVTLTGVIRPVNEVDVFTKLPGRVESVSVKVGDKVTKGQVLAVIEHREILLQNEQATAQAEASSAGLESAKANHAASRAMYERYKNLRAQNAVPQAEFERMETAYQSASAGLRAAEAQARMAVASRDLAAEALRNSRVAAPISGTITRKQVNLGTQVSPMQALFQIQDVAKLRLEGTVSARQYMRLKRQQPAAISVEELPKQTFAGRLLTLSPTLDPQNRRAALELEIENAHGALLPNMFAKAVLETGKQENAKVIPASAVVSLAKGKVVYVVKGAKAHAVTPVFGTLDDSQLVIESGLDVGDSVVVQGQENLTDGATVSVLPANARAGAQ